MTNPPVGGFPVPAEVPSFDKLAERPLVDTVILPSNGLPYGGSLHGGRVRISAITVREEKMFSSASSSADVIATSIIDSTCDLGPVGSSEQLILGDRFFLLMQLRAKSYGNLYGFPFRCSDCKEQWRHEIDISRDLKLKPRPQVWEEPWSLKLPISGITVGYRMLRGMDERNIADTIRRRTLQQQRGKAPQSNFEYVMQIAAHIVSVDGKDIDEFVAAKFAEGLIGGDVGALQDAIEERMPGYDPEIVIDCPKCGFRHYTSVPMSTEFFRPRNSR